MDRNIAIELVRVSEFEALATSKFIVCGDEKYAETHSIVMRSKTGTIRHINGEHNFNIKQLEY